MGKEICQIVDSAGSIPREFLKAHQIYEVPFYFKFDQTDYVQGTSVFGIKEFYRHMQDAPDDVPKTSAPNVNDYLQVFEQAYEDGYRQFIVTTISEQLSSSFPNASAAKDAFIQRHSDVAIQVYNSNTCACGQAALEVGIAHLIGSGISYEAVLEKTVEMMAHTTSLFSVHSLKYMKAGGRIGGATAFLGKLMNIQPVCEFIEGVVKPIKATRGRKNSLKTMAEIGAKRLEKQKKYVIVVQHALYTEDAETLIQEFVAASGYPLTIYQSDLGIVVGAHSGPGAIGIGIVPLA